MTEDGPTTRYVSAALRANSIIEMIYACTEASCNERVRTPPRNARAARHAVSRVCHARRSRPARASQNSIYSDVFVWHHMLGAPGIIAAEDIGIQPEHMKNGHLKQPGMARINIHNQVRQLTAQRSRRYLRLAEIARPRKPRDRAAACLAQIDFGPNEKRLICIVYLRALKAPNRPPNQLFYTRLESSTDVSSAPRAPFMESGCSSHSADLLERSCDTN